MTAATMGWTRQRTGSPSELRLLEQRQPRPGLSWPKTALLRGDLIAWDYSAELMLRREESARVRLSVHVDVEIPRGADKLDLLSDFVEVLINGDPMVDHNLGGCLWSEVEPEWFE